MNFHPTHKKAIEPVITAPDGTEFYRFVSMEDYSPARVVWLTEYLRLIALGVDQNTYKIFSEAQARAIEAQDWDALKQSRWLMDELVLRSTITETYYDIASVLLFTLEEDIHQHDLGAARAKKDILKTLAPAFFFNTLSAKPNFLILKLPSDIENFLVRNEAKIKATLMSLSKIG